MAKREAGEAGPDEISEFVVSLVESWDYIDPETGQVVPLDQWQELTIEQYQELTEVFNKKMESQANVVKKTNESP